jgi:hypothetical protein
VSRFFVVLVAAVACGGRLTTKQIVTASKPAIVLIIAGDDQFGTGFVVDKSGLVATNLHVVRGKTTVKVKLLDGTVYDVARVVGIDEEHDLALLDIDPPQQLPALRLGDSDKVEPGDPALVIGNPLGILDYTVSDGLISSVRTYEPPNQKPIKLIQTSAPISQGSSGGPLFNSVGEVVGVATLIVAPHLGQNLNFAMPSNYLKALVLAPKPMTMAAFAKETTPEEEEEPPRVIDVNGLKIVRKVPKHKEAVLDGCGEADAKAVFVAIGDAIAIGAPMYNQGRHEDCFREYERTVMKWEKEAKCTGVRSAFGDGLLRAGTVTTFTEKAWVLRDTFDGLLRVIVTKYPGVVP